MVGVAYGGVFGPPLHPLNKPVARTSIANTRNLIFMFASRKVWNNMQMIGLNPLRGNSGRLLAPFLWCPDPVCSVPTERACTRNLTPQPAKVTQCYG